MEREFIMLKPDGVKRRLVGEIFGRFERAGLNITAMKMLQLTKEQAASLYPDNNEWFIALGNKAKKAFGEHGEEFNVDSLQHGKQIKKWVVEYVSSGPVIVAIAEGNDAVYFVRKFIGSTDARVAQPGTIRGDFLTDTIYTATKEKRANRTLIHASESRELAEREIKLFFGN